MTFWYGPRSADLYQWTDPDPRIRTIDRIQIQIRIRILLFSSVAVKMPTKISTYLSFFPYSFLRVLKLHLHQLSKIKVMKLLQNSRNKGFSYYFCLTMKGSGSRRSRIREAQKLTDPANSIRVQNLTITKIFANHRERFHIFVSPLGFSIQKPRAF